MPQTAFNSSNLPEFIDFAKDNKTKGHITYQGEVPKIDLGNDNSNIIYAILMIVFFAGFIIVLSNIPLGFLLATICSVPFFYFYYSPYFYAKKRVKKTGKKLPFNFLAPCAKKTPVVQKILEHDLVENPEKLTVKEIEIFFRSPLEKQLAGEEETQRQRIQNQKEANRAKIIRLQLQDPSSFGLWVGKSLGSLITLWHRSGIEKGQQISLGLEDACQNILALGGIGSGKTTCVMHPLLLQCLAQQCGGLIFDIKGDFKNAVKQFTDTTKAKLVVIGPNHTKINLLSGLTPEIAASFLKSAFLLNDKGRMDSFWIDTATELCRNTLGLLSFLPEHYNLQSLYLYLFDIDSQTEINELLDKIVPTLDKSKERLLNTYRRYHDSVYAQFDAKIRSGVNATVAQALSPFNHPDLLDAFCSAEGKAMQLNDVLNGTVYLIDMPLAIWGLGGKVAYTFIKLRFFNLMQNRNQTQEGNNSKPVFFMCDEFQEIVSANRDGLSDLSFWDKSRSSKTIGIISSQSIASFYAALGSHDLANALLQNFRQKLCFRTEDPLTLEFMDRLVGRAKVKKLSVTHNYQSATANNQVASNYFSKTVSESREGVVDAQLFRELKPNQAIAILSLAGHSMDDVLGLIPIYVN